MRTRQLAGALARVVSSVLFAGLFHAGWLALFLTMFRIGPWPVRGVLWGIAPVITAAGFAVGLLAAARPTGASRPAPLRTFVWPLAGCTLGAVSVVWIGPMFIGFGMFLGGTGSVVLREIVGYSRARRG